MTLDLRALKIALLASTIALAACGSAAQPRDAGPSDGGSNDAGPGDGGSNDAGPGDGGPSDLVEGEILFRGLGEGIAFSVELYQAPIAAPPVIVRGDGHCDIRAAGEAGDGFVTQLPPGTLDLGANVTATNASTMVTAAVDTTGGNFQYVGTEAGIDAFAKTWTLANSGSASLAAAALLSVQVPARVVPIVPAPEGGMVDTTSGHVTLQWTGGEGAQSFHVNLTSSKAEVDCYPAATATSFELPAGVIAVLDATATPILWAETVGEVQVGTRTVWVRVTSDNLD